MKARDVYVGLKFKSGNTVQEVTAIEKISNKTITFRTNRISPDPYNGNLFNRWNLDKDITKLINRG